MKWRMPKPETIQRAGGWVASVGMIVLGAVRLLQSDFNAAIGLWTAGGTFVLIIEGMMANSIAQAEHAMHNCPADECPVVRRRAA